MVKKILVDAGLYQLSDEDSAARKGCEAFLAHDLLSPVDEVSDERWWNRVDSEISHSLFADALLSFIDPESE
jgi:hypothetical protein